jgi:ABC-type dipeptide/oligopeptide/nickel transport system ATPase component
MIHPPPGCAFHPRCFLTQGRELCRVEDPALRPIEGTGQSAACHFAEELEEAAVR